MENWKLSDEKFPLAFSKVVKFCLKDNNSDDQFLNLVKFFITNILQSLFKLLLEIEQAIDTMENHILYILLRKYPL